MRGGTCVAFEGEEQVNGFDAMPPDDHGRITDPKEWQKVALACLPHHNRDLIADVVSRVRVVPQCEGPFYALAATLPLAQGIRQDLIPRSVRHVMDKLMLNREHRVYDELFAAGHKLNSCGNYEADVARLLPKSGSAFVVGAPFLHNWVDVVGYARWNDNGYIFGWRHILVMKRGACITYRSPGDGPGDVVDGWRVNTSVDKARLVITLSCNERQEIVNPNGIGFVV